jgi:beta-N-acetylhexosaminidase
MRHYLIVFLLSLAIGLVSVFSLHTFLHAQSDVRSDFQNNFASKAHIVKSRTTSGQDAHPASVSTTSSSVSNPTQSISSTTSQTVDSYQIQKEKVLQSIEKEVLKMSLEEKVGSLMIFGFKGTTPNDHIQTLIEKYHVGGVNLLGWNSVDAEQVKTLTSSLQDIYTKDHPHTFIIATDQEGGVVNRFSFLKEKTAQSSIKDANHAYEIGQRRGRELSELGVNMNFGPISDLVTNKKSYLYKRTFATELPDDIVKKSRALSQGYRDSGVMSSFKHFPGYGNTVLDPHKKIAMYKGATSTFETGLHIFESLLKPTTHNKTYNNSYTNKNKDASFLKTYVPTPVMTAHVIVPWVSKKPATESYEFMTSILRDEIGFDGVVITDDLDMASAGKDVGSSAIDSINAGADMIISTPKEHSHISIVTQVIEAVRRGDISEERINSAAMRVLLLRKSLPHLVDNSTNL